MAAFFTWAEFHFLNANGSHKDDSGWPTTHVAGQVATLPQVSVHSLQSHFICRKNPRCRRGLHATNFNYKVETFWGVGHPNLNLWGVRTPTTSTEAVPLLATCFGVRLSCWRISVRYLTKLGVLGRVDDIRPFRNSQRIAATKQRMHLISYERLLG